MTPSRKYFPCRAAPGVGRPGKRSLAPLGLLPLVPWLALWAATPAAELERLPFNNPALAVDLGVGLWAWPVPMDFNGDGKLDLVVVCPDTPYNGTYFFENTGSDPKMPLFKPGVRISKGISNVSPSYVDGRSYVLSPGCEYPDFRRSGLENPVKLPLGTNIHSNKVRANQWRYVDYDGDGTRDLVVGVEDWSDYGWDNAFDAAGKWTHGPLHGYVYLLRNQGSREQPRYEAPVKIEAGGKPIDVFGMPSPCFADFRGTGKLDLICGSFLDGFTWFENIGTRTRPRYAAGRPLANRGKPLTMDLEMIVPVAVDWDGDGRVDLIVGQEDGRVALVANSGEVLDGMPQFMPPRFFRQQAGDVKFGVLVTPVGCDWDGDGREDLVCGNSAGYLGFLKNLGGEPPRWAPPEYLAADGRVIRIMAGPNGSIQGPAEAKWGYTTLSVADWDGDGLPDLVVNSIWGKVVWFRNVGTRTQPKLAAAQPIEVEWPGPPPKPAWNWWNPAGKELATQWRTTPVVFDLNQDGLSDLVMLDHEGYLTFFERVRRGDGLRLLPGKRVFTGENGCVFDGKHALVDKSTGPLRLNDGVAGKSGRRKFCMADWDGDGKPDLLVNSRNVNFLKNVSVKPGEIIFRDMGPLDSLVLAGHDTSPTEVHWDPDGIADLLVGAEDGRMYLLRNPRHARTKSPRPAVAVEPAVVKTEFVFETAPFASCHASTIVETHGGLVAAWFGGTKEGHADVGIWLSRQQQGRWTAPEEVAAGVEPDGKRFACYNPVLFQPPGGPLMLFYKVGGHPKGWWGYRKTSSDGGATWSQAERLPPPLIGPVKNKPVILADGTLLSGSSTEDDGWRVHFERSTDGGHSWKFVGPVNDGKQIAAIQPSILFHPGGRLQAVGRTRQGKVFEIWSEDGGQSWGQMTLTALPNPNSGIDAVTLRDGRQLLVYNHTPKGRSPLGVAVSRDGKQWQPALLLESAPGEFSYPAVVQTNDALVHITYTWKRQRIKHVVVDPAKLE